MNQDKKWQMTTMALGSLGLLALVSPPSHAATKGETIEIQGHDIDVCAEDYGPAWAETADSKPGDIQCECVATDELSCGSGTDYDSPDLGGGLGDWKQPGAGGWTPPDVDECTAEDPEPEVCGLETCESCQAALDECEDAAFHAVSSCEYNNRKLASTYCRIHPSRGLSLEQCIEYETTGTPGIAEGTSKTNGTSHGYGTGASGLFGLITIGVDGKYSWSDSNTTSTTVTYPPKEPDYDYYEDCSEVGRDRAKQCYEADVLCIEDAEAKGEACAE